VRLGLATVVGLRDEARQRLPVGVQRLLGPADVGQPVAESVEAARVQERIGERLRQVAGTSVEVAGLGVVAFGPEEPERCASASAVSRSDRAWSKSPMSS
jgi:hypothetical protein